MTASRDDREGLIRALHEWEKASMSTGMGAFLQFAKEQGMSAPQVGALIHIHRKGTCGVTDIGDDLGVTSAAASQMLDRLVQSGLVERREDPEDRRARRMSLTEQGLRVVQASVEIRQRHFAALAERMSPRERRSAAAALRTLVARSLVPSPSKKTPARRRRNAKEHPDQ